MCVFMCASAYATEFVNVLVFVCESARLRLSMCFLCVCVCVCVCVSYVLKSVLTMYAQKEFCYRQLLRILFAIESQFNVNNATLGTAQNKPVPSL